jgi:pimeloyl-ACP methyl ester carboxylesterase
MRGAWIGALGGAVVAGAAGAAVAGSRRHRGRQHGTDVPDDRPGDATSVEPRIERDAGEETARLRPALPVWPDSPGLTVTTEDGLRLHAEVAGDPDADITMIFVHGYGLSRRSWRFQRRDLAGEARLVFYDHRSHGASGRSRAERCTIDQLAADLHAVIEQLGGNGPVVLVGHSMGGMTVLALAARAPELFGTRIVGVALLSTSAGRLSELTLGLPKAAGLVLRRVQPRHLVGLSKGMPLLLAVSRPRAALRRGDRSVRAGVVSSVVQRFSFGGDVDTALVADVESMIASTGIDVLAAFAPTFLDHDKLDALPVLERVPTAVLVGDEDLMTPVEHARAIADALPDAELQVLSGVGHMVTTERPDEVARTLRRLLDRCRLDSAA